ncbi:uncharacterized protein N0V89_001723 [Didymosphaeria variabile]|uniref:NAD(P)-binding protein n=1 Tax=Didymosphaeria variabile TaxID=1932322 RepID=A0A9W8XS52_9PLEO|nr:uncharacterized protein N0V89_001723 [Didymosphaeria variabile]KAJ4357148.1 hypothetical protein N0V89_001723 [Didymosphaeria variabile]
MATETVLIVGSTGHIGTSAAQGALKAGLSVLAIVRNARSAEKLFRNLGSKERITTVEADVTSPTGVQCVVDQVKAGRLPAFQHVYSCVGGPYDAESLYDLDDNKFLENMTFTFYPNFYAYRATIPYLLAQNHPNSTWTICTGGQGDIGARPGAGMAQGALYSMSTSAARQNKETNIRFNEVYLFMRVEVDAEAEAHGVQKASHFANVYETLLSRNDVRSARVLVTREEDLDVLRFEYKDQKLLEVGTRLLGAFD